MDQYSSSDLTLIAIAGIFIWSLILSYIIRSSVRGALRDHAEKADKLQRKMTIRKLTQEGLTREEIRKFLDTSEADLLDAVKN